MRCDLEMAAAFRMLCGVFVKDYNPNHNPENGRFTSGTESGIIEKLGEKDSCKRI